MPSRKALDQTYPMSKSPLFRMLGKGQLECAIGLSWDEAARLLKPRYYRSWKNSKNRDIQQPLYELEKLHSRIANLLSRIDMPEYVFSKRGRSYVDNADQHRGRVPLVKTDLNKFYPSTTWSMIFRLFVDRFQCAEDIAARLADLCCFEQKHLPTGSALSGYIAFFVAQPLFDRIATIFAEQGCVITLLVDDLTASGEGATKKALADVRAAIRHYGFKTRDEKSKTYGASMVKGVTGAIVAGDELRLPNKQHLKIWQARRALPTLPANRRQRALQSLVGRIQQADQILKRQTSMFEICVG